MTRKAKAMCFVPNNDNKKCGKTKAWQYELKNKSCLGTSTSKANL